MDNARLTTSRPPRPKKMKIQKMLTEGGLQHYQFHEEIMYSKNYGAAMPSSQKETFRIIQQHKAEESLSEIILFETFRDHLVS